MNSFWNGFEKRAADAEERPEGHHIRRAILGTPISSAIEAKKGKKMQAYRHAYGHAVKENLKGLGVGAAGGAGAGLLASGISHLTGHNFPPGSSAAAGAMIGGGLGGIVGAIKGSHGAEASKIHGMYSKHKND